MSSLISKVKPLSGMMIEGYSIGILGKEGRVFYGMFNTVEDAENWLGDLSVHATIIPIYAPVGNRG